MSSQTLRVLPSGRSHTFAIPAKRINEGQDVATFLTTRAYHDICAFIGQLNHAMCPRKTDEGKTLSWQLDTDMQFSDTVQKLQELLRRISSIIEEAPPDTGPRRFGNISFRKWYEVLEGRIEELLRTYLPSPLLDFSTTSESPSVLAELTPYILGGFGSAQRLDYGTGHELSFIAFLGCLWKLGAFSNSESKDGSIEREIAIGIIEPYLRVVRKLILTYTLEPAGSHGVWGLDDHSFISYILGSAQYSPAIGVDDIMPVEGSQFGSPKTADVIKKNIVEKERQHNMYFSAIGFIYDVKTGPFWEHSPILFDISGVPQGWGKINKGMLKMYNAEVLSKFPVVQHFPFGSLFSWEQDPNAEPTQSTIHTSSQPISMSSASQDQNQQATKAPWATGPAANSVSTQAPWATTHTQHPQASTRAPWVTQPSQVSGGTSRIPDGPTRAPWAKNT